MSQWSYCCHVLHPTLQCCHGDRWGTLWLGGLNISYMWLRCWDTHTHTRWWGWLGGRTAASSVNHLLKIETCSLIPALSLCLSVCLLTVLSLSLSLQSVTNTQPLTLPPAGQLVSLLQATVEDWTETNRITRRPLWETESPNRTLNWTGSYPGKLNGQVQINTLMDYNC